MNYEYNTERERLIIPEYGRNIQKLVNYAKQIEAREERNRFAKSIIKVMATINPNYRDRSDFNQKLWDHLAIISDFELDIDSPFEKPTKEVLYEKPKPIPYCKNRIRYKHYGHVAEMMIKKAIEMEEGKEQQALIELIANHMKRLYVTWNPDQSVDDEQILRDLEELTGGKLKVDKNLKLIEIKDIQSRGTNTNKKKKNYRKMKY
jgi:hypothetical protein